jgi:hypothetical protein
LRLGASNAPFHPSASILAGGEIISAVGVCYIGQMYAGILICPDTNLVNLGANPLGFKRILWYD